MRFAHIFFRPPSSTHCICLHTESISYKILVRLGCLFIFRFCHINVICSVTITKGIGKCHRCFITLFSIKKFVFSFFFILLNESVNKRLHQSALGPSFCWLYLTQQQQQQWCAHLPSKSLEPVFIYEWASYFQQFFQIEMCAYFLFHSWIE